MQILPEIRGRELLKMFDILKYVIEIFKFIIELIVKYGIRFNKSSYYIKDEDINIECGNLVDDITKINTKIDPTTVKHKYTIAGKDLICNYSYKGLIRKNGVAACEFVFSSTNAIPYSEMDCYAIDNIINERQIPKLIGSDGLVKKISVGFSNTLQVGQNFDIFLHINLKECVADNKDYVISRINYAVAHIAEYSIEITFDERAPKTINVYVMKSGSFRREKTIYPSKKDKNTFYDRIDHNEAVSLRAYVFERGDKDVQI